MAQSLDGLAVAAAHGGEQIHGRLRAELEKPIQVRAVEPERRRLLSGNHGGAAGALIEHREFAEEIASRGDLEHDAFAGVVLEKHLDLARADDVDGVARFAVVEDRLAAGKVDDLEVGGEFRALVIVEQFEERNFLE